MANWHCIKQCGACCHLDPQDRPELSDYLSPEELKHYLSLVGEEGWCINFDHDTRECKIYEQRPSFCRVTPDSFQRMYKIEESEFNDFAIDCCCQQIEWMYGDDSPEMDRYLQSIDN